MHVNVRKVIKFMVGAGTSAMFALLLLVIVGQYGLLRDQIDELRAANEVATTCPDHIHVRNGDQVPVEGTTAVVEGIMRDGTLLCSAAYAFEGVDEHFSLDENGAGVEAVERVTFDAINVDLFHHASLAYCSEPFWREPTTAWHTVRVVNTTSADVGLTLMNYHESPSPVFDTAHVGWWVAPGGEVELTNLQTERLYRLCSEGSEESPCSCLWIDTSDSTADVSDCASGMTGLVAEPLRVDKYGDVEVEITEDALVLTGHVSVYPIS